MEIALVIAVIAAIFIVRTFKIVPQQHAWVVERLGKYDRTLTPGLKFVVPFIERVAYKHSLKEVPLDVPSQVCITKRQHPAAGRRHHLFPGHRPDARELRLEQLRLRDHAARADAAALGDRQDGARQDLRGARHDQRLGGQRARRGGAELGREGAALRDQGPDAAGGDPALDAGADHRRAREARADRRVRRPASRSRSTSPPASARPSSRAPRASKQAEINKAQGEAAAIIAVADATADAIRKIAEAIRSPGGEQAVQLKVAETAVEAYSQLAQKNNTMIVPGNMTRGVGADRARAMTLMKARTPGTSG